MTRKDDGTFTHTCSEGQNGERKYEVTLDGRGRDFVASLIDQKRKMPIQRLEIPWWNE